MREKKQDLRTAAYLHRGSIGASAEYNLRARRLEHSSLKFPIAADCIPDGMGGVLTCGASCESRTIPCMTNLFSSLFFYYINSLDIASLRLVACSCTYFSFKSSSCVKRLTMLGPPLQVQDI